MKPNDEVICIDNRSNGSSYIMMDVALTIGKYYIVQNLKPLEYLMMKICSKTLERIDL